MIWGASIGLIVGLVLGWYVRSGKQMSATRMIDELYGRKLRLAESDRDAAQKALNDNVREMGTFEERFAALDAQIEQLLGEVATAHKAQQGAENDARRRGEELAALRDEIGRAREFAEEALQESSEAAQERDAAVAAMERARGELALREREVGELSARLRESHASNAELALDLRQRADLLEAAAAAQLTASSDLAATQVELERARARLALLEGLEPELAVVRAALGQRMRELTDRDGNIAVLTALVGELQSLPARLQSAEAELAAERGEHARRLAELERVWSERHAAELAAKAAEIDELDARVTSLAPYEPEAAALRARVAELERWRERAASEEQRAEGLAQALERERDSARELAARVEGLVREFDDVRRQLAETSSRLAAANERAQSRADELEAEQQRARGLDSQVAELRGAIAAARRECAALAHRESQATKRAESLEQKLERERARASQAETRVAAQADELDTARRGRTDQDKQLAALGASHRAKQLDLDRRAAKLAELQGAVKERDARIRELVAGQRARGAAGGSNGAAHGSARDDLKLIAGIGPALERKLHRLGLRSFRQLASLSPSELERIAGRLGTTPERIRREGWITAARGALRAKGA